MSILKALQKKQAEDQTQDNDIVSKITPFEEAGEEFLLQRRKHFWIRSSASELRQGQRSMSSLYLISGWHSLIRRRKYLLGNFERCRLDAHC